MVKLERRWLLLPWVAWTSLSLIVSQMAVFYTPNKVSIKTSTYRTFSQLNVLTVADHVHYPRHLLHGGLHLLHHVRLLLLPGRAEYPASEWNESHIFTLPKFWHNIHPWLQTLSEAGGEERGHVTSLRVTSQSTWTGAAQRQGTQSLAKKWLKNWRFEQKN